MGATFTKTWTQVTLQTDFEAALKHTVDALKAAGFTIMVQIDMQEALKKKLDVALRQYKILSVLNPDLAQRALTIAPEAGLVLLNHVVVAEGPNGLIDVLFIDPTATCGLLAKTYLLPIAHELQDRLERVADTLREA
jgi:uncharacterized protein (DUF302 family)